MVHPGIEGCPSRAQNSKQPVMWNGLDICIRVLTFRFIDTHSSLLHTTKLAGTNKARRCHVDSRELQSTNSLGLQKQPQHESESTDGKCPQGHRNMFSFIVRGKKKITPSASSLIPVCLREITSYLT